MHTSIRIIVVLCCLAAVANGDSQATARETASLRSAILDLKSTFGSRYAGAGTYLRRLDAIEPRLIDLRDSAARDAFAALQREALTANPLVSGQPILFVVRHQYAPDHHNTATFFPAAAREYNDGRFQGGGAVKVIDFARGGQVRTLVDLPKGVARDPDVSFDGGRILFSMRRDVADSYHVYEINADSSGLKQLTCAKDVDDLDPLYLPSGQIAFSGTREPKYCACNRHIMANLFRMEADGANIRQVGRSTLFEEHGSVMPDGRILYDRWEYVDRNFGDAQGLWTCNPDGTSHNIFWGNNTPAPGAVVDGRAIPGTELVVCTFTSCHDRPWGAIAIVDSRRGLDGRAPVVRIWPPDAMGLVKDPGTAKDAFDAFTAVRLKYEDPYPLADQRTNAGAGKYFLCSRMTGEREKMGIYLIDVFGNELLLHAEGPGCFDPMPLAARATPPVIPDRSDSFMKEGWFYVQDIYRGTHMEGVKRGSVKYLRVVESPEKRFWTLSGWNGQGFEGPAMNWHDFGNKTILGTVKVEEDGSAYFAVPSEKFVFFQLLDENGMMVQSMRSGTVVQPNEKSSCIGCHEDRRTVPAGGAHPAAVRNLPAQLSGWRGQVRPFSFLRDVQPVLDQHCVRCHDHAQARQNKVDLSRDRGLVFNVAYTELWTKGYTGAVGAGPAQIMPAKSWGSHASRLVKLIRDGHYDVRLDADSMRRIVTWVDLNAPYYPSFASSYPDHLYGRSPLNNADLGRLARLTGVKMEAPNVVDFDRPELSACLQRLSRNDSGYAEALAIIESGRRALEKNPNPDVDSFIPCETDRWRQEKYELRQQWEMRSREAILAGRRVYDQ